MPKPINFKNGNLDKFTTGFTLVELLIVIGVLATLATVSVLVINPAQMLAQSRDSRRLAELRSFGSALSLAEVNNLSLGSSNVVYVSLPDASSTCFNSGLPSLPTGWSYQCSSSANHRKVDGSGWVPVNFGQIPSGSPLSVLPVDPINTTSTGNYYVYVAGGSYKLTALLESEKYVSRMNKDGGPDAGLYETGSNLNLANFQRGLAGYWKLDETNGVLSDSSGQGNNGTQSGGVTYGAVGKTGNALSFDGVDDYVSALNSASLNLNDTVSVMFWLKDNGSTGSYSSVISKINAPVSGYNIQRNTLTATIYMRIDTSGGGNQAFGPLTSFLDGNWHHAAFVLNNGNRYAYKDGLLVTASAYNHGTGFAAPSRSLTLVGGGIRAFIDEVKIYNRALSAAEIKAIYDATK